MSVATATAREVTTGIATGKSKERNLASLAFLGALWFSLFFGIMVLIVLIVDTAITGSVSLRLSTSCGTPGSMKMKSPASLSTACSSAGPYSCRTRPWRMYSITSKSTWMCAYATPPGGIVATFIDSRLAAVFFAERPLL